MAALVTLNESKIRSDAVLAGATALIGGITYLVVHKKNEKMATPAMMMATAFAPLILVQAVKLLNK